MLAIERGIISFKAWDLYPLGRENKQLVRLLPHDAV